MSAPSAAERRIFLAGATGFTGMAMLRRAAQPSGYSVVAQARPSSADRLAPMVRPHITVSTVDLADTAALAAAMAGCEVVIQLIGTTAQDVAAGKGNYESVDLATTRQLIEGAKRAGVPRMFFLSSVLVSPRRRLALIVPAEFFRVKYEAEQAVRSSGLAWTVWRPAFITGQGRNRPNEAVGAAALGAVARSLKLLGGRGLADRIRPITADQLAASFEHVVFAPRPEQILTGTSLWDTVPEAVPR